MPPFCLLWAPFALLFPRSGDWTINQTSACSPRADSRGRALLPEPQTLKGMFSPSLGCVSLSFATPSFTPGLFNSVFNLQMPGDSPGFPWHGLPDRAPSGHRTHGGEADGPGRAVPRAGVVRPAVPLRPIGSCSLLPRLRCLSLQSCCAASTGGSAHASSQATARLREWKSRFCAEPHAGSLLVRRVLPDIIPSAQATPTLKTSMRLCPGATSRSLTFYLPVLSWLKWALQIKCNWVAFVSTLPVCLLISAFALNVT